MHPWLGDILAIAHQNGLKVNLTFTMQCFFPKNISCFWAKQHPVRFLCPCTALMPIPCIPRDFRSYLENAIDFGTFTMTTPGYISFRLWNLDGTAKADQRLRNQFILETLEKAYHLAQPIDAYVGRSRQRHCTPHTYVNFDQLFEWPDEHAPDYGFNGTCMACGIGGDSGRWPGRSMLSGPQRPSGFGQYFHRIPGYSYPMQKKKSPNHQELPVLHLMFMKICQSLRLRTFLILQYRGQTDARYHFVNDHFRTSRMALPLIEIDFLTLFQCHS